MNRETIRARLKHHVFTSVYAQESAEWAAGRYAEGRVDCPWSEAAALLTLPTPVKFGTHGCRAAVERHAHPQTEMMYVLSGEIVHHFDDEKTVMGEGDLLIIAPGESHAVDACGPDAIAVNIIAEESFLMPEFLALLSGCVPVTGILSHTKNPRHVLLSGRGDGAAATLADLLISEFLDPDVSSVNMIKCYLAALLNALYRVYGENVGRVYQTKDRERGDVSFILSYLQNHFATATLAEASRLFGYDKYYLSKVIRKKLGLSFIEAKHYFCVEEAKRLLTETEISVRAVSERVGFSNMSYFYKIFAESCGMTPAQYREQSIN
jgi:AraC-like DNA-binding protein/mannose-6-phosphate isomerase-like protein (cupin superfamily)